jgi:hypothetical protein
MREKRRSAVRARIGNLEVAHTQMTEKLKVRCEFEKDGPLLMARPHRQFFGRGAVSEPVLFEVEWEEHEELYGCAKVDAAEGTLGRAARCDKAPGLVITPDPALYGTDADRTAAGKLTFKKLNFGEWNFLNAEEL